jgi:hypothetical protein
VSDLLSDLPDILALEDTEPVELIEEELPSDYEELLAAHFIETPAHDETDSMNGVLLGAEPVPGRMGAAAPSINGFICGSAQAVGVKNFRVPGTDVTVPLRADVAPLTLGFAAEFHTKVERLRKGWCWGYAARSIRGPSTKPSFHWAAIAGDWNAPLHPLGKVNTFPAAKRPVIRALARKYGLRWGGDYRQRKDEMHTEVIVVRQEALKLVRRLQTPVKLYLPPNKPVPVRRDPVLRNGAIGQSVTNIQNALLKAGFSLGPRGADGRFGDRTEAALRAFQRSRGLTIDGVCGPASWAALRKVVHG